MNIQGNNRKLKKKKKTGRLKINAKLDIKLGGTGHFQHLEG